MSQRFNVLLIFHLFAVLRITFFACILQVFWTSISGSSPGIDPGTSGPSIHLDRFFDQLHRVRTTNGAQHQQSQVRCLPIAPN